MEEKDKDKLEKAKVLINFISLAIIPLVIAFLGNFFSESLKQKDVEVKFVELAINILSQNPDTARSNIRTWAANILEEYSEVPFSDSTTSDIVNKLPIITNETREALGSKVRVRLKQLIVIENGKINNSDSEKITLRAVVFSYAYYKSLFEYQPKQTVYDKKAINFDDNDNIEAVITESLNQPIFLHVEVRSSQNKILGEGFIPISDTTLEGDIIIQLKIPENIKISDDLMSKILTLKKGFANAMVVLKLEKII